MCSVGRLCVPCPMRAHVCSASANAYMDTDIFQAWKMLAASHVRQRSCQSAISISAATEPRGRTRHVRGSGGGNCRARGSGIAAPAAAPGANEEEDDAAGCVVELLEAALPAAAWRLAAPRRCAKATRNAMDAGCLVTKARRLRGQSALSCGTGACQGASASVMQLPRCFGRKKRMHTLLCAMRHCNEFECRQAHLTGQGLRRRHGPASGSTKQMNGQTRGTEEGKNSRARGNKRFLARAPAPW